MQGRDMERTIKIWLSIIFPGLLGFVASCLVILPQLTTARPRRALGYRAWAFPSRVPSLSSSRGCWPVTLDDDDIPEEEPAPRPPGTAPFAVTVR
jgi:hypothetical protein